MANLIDQDGQAGAPFKALNYLEINGKTSGFTAQDIADAKNAIVNGTPLGSAINRKFSKVDLSAWDLAVYCGSCHPGGGFVEKDRNGKRFSQMNPMVDGFTPLTMYVYERYNPLDGSPSPTAEMAPWSYPLYMGGQAVVTPGGWGQAMFSPVSLPDGSTMAIADGQVMMPNVKEFDCLMCHAQGFSNMMSSVMTYSGALNAVPSFGAGFMNMFTEAYDFTTGLISKDSNGQVFYSAANLNKKPNGQNCEACHLPSGLKDLPDMMRDFLSSAPMIFNNSFAKSFTGLTMPAYDFNAPFAMTWDWKAGPFATTPVITMGATGLSSTTVFDLMIPAGFPAAMGMSEFNAATAMSTPGFIGGANPAGTFDKSGPIFYQCTIPNSGGMQNQDYLKKSIVPFPRAEWFKRGDLYAPEYDVHYALDCKGCHMDTKTTKVDSDTFDGKSLCDPGRGTDSASSIETATENYPQSAITVFNVNSQNTVKKCSNCHETGKNSDGVLIDAFGAPNSVAAHQAAGLNAKITQSVKLDANGNEVTFAGSHIDVVDCTVCHLARKQMVVRSLDSTSGHRYPNMIGFNPQLGMMGLFSDPYGDATPMVAQQQAVMYWNAQGVTNPTQEQIDMVAGMITFPRNNNLTEWRPIYGWQKWGDAPKTVNGAVNADWRRKVYAFNYITAIIWNNTNNAIDANGDGIGGREPSIHKHNTDGTTTTNYDPWISRDMKAGLNFGPSGFAPIPVGFGNGSYMSAYNADGSFTGAWKYVGVYGGNIAFSTPEEIATYKAFRGPDWADTKLAYLGAPFKVTHGIRSTSAFVLGAPDRDTAGNITNAFAGCTDCHATGKNFFDGSFDMVGTAIKTTAGGQFMMSPATTMDVVANAHDLETGAELARKAGTAAEPRFEEEGCWTFDAVKGENVFTAYNGTTCTEKTYKKVAPLERSVALYPDEVGDTVTKYYPDGTFTAEYKDIKGTSYPNRAAWVSYLTSAAANPAAFGLGIDPVADIATVNAQNAAEGTTTITVTKGAPVAIVAANGGTAGSFAYSWLVNDGGSIVNGQSTSYTFNQTGLWTVTLTVVDEEGKVATTFQKVNVVAADPITVGTITTNAVTKVTTLPLSISGTYTKVVFSWGDGTAATTSFDVDGTVSIDHKYTRFSKYFVADIDPNTAGNQPGYKYTTTVSLYNGTTLVTTKAITVIAAQ